MKYSLGVFKNFTSESPFIINETVINTLIKINNTVTNTVLQFKTEPFVYKFKPAKYVHTQREAKEDPIIEIKSNLNRLTDSNILTIASNILKLLKEETFEIIFDISYKNKFLSKTFTELIIIISEKNDAFKSFIQKKFDLIYDMFENIKYVPDTNYNEYCDNVKEVENRISFCCFFAHLSLNNFIEITKVQDFINHLLEKVTTIIDEEDKKNDIDEILETVFIISGILKIIPLHDIIKTISSSKPKIHKGLTSKSIFKCMDILDIKI